MFFAFQLGVAFIGAICAGFVLWRILPHSIKSSHLGMFRLKSVWRFAAGMSLNAILWMILSQLDKIILIKILPLKMFGYYALASTAAAAVTYLCNPLYTTFLPRYTQLYAAGNDELLRMTYRTSCRLNAIIMIPTIVLLALYSKAALQIWTGNLDIAEHAYMLLSLLVIGYGLSQLALLPIALQIATGWVKLGVYTNAIAVIIYVPALVIATRFYGALGAAVIWIALNCFYVFFYVNVMHNKILRGESRYWYIGTLLPLILAVGLGLAGRHLILALPALLLIASVAFMWIMVVVTAVLATADLRGKAISLFR